VLLKCQLCCYALLALPLQASQYTGLVLAFGGREGAMPASTASVTILGKAFGMQLAGLPG